ncbi:MAG: hypothetical protein H7227_02765 [Actinobacteria bacterium]|nr:hypothetical protein [Actinomycetota bacterium]
MNPASRLLQLLQEMDNGNGNVSVTERWQQVLKIDPELPSAAEDAIEGMRAALSEVRALEQQLARRNLPSDLFAPTAKVLRQCLAPQNTGSAWKDVGLPTREGQHKMCLKWASWTLSDSEEEQISDEMLSELSVRISQHADFVAAAQLPARLRTLLEGQIEALRSALRFYSLRGAGPLRDAVNKSVGELRTAASDLVEETVQSGREAKKAVLDASQLLGKAAEAADKGSKLFKFSKEVLEIGSTVWKAIN